MYAFTKEEHEKLTRFFLPRSRESAVSEDLRGWSWNHPPLEPIYDVRLGVAEVASNYCPTNRDLYLRKAQGLKAAPNEAMVAGIIFHELLCQFIIRAKRALYWYGKDAVDTVLKELWTMDSAPLTPFKTRLTTEQLSDLERKANLVHRYEFRTFAARLEEILARQPHIGLDALVSMVLPVVVEQKLDGTRLGLSPFLHCDAFSFCEPVIIDFKFGPKRHFHILGPTGYALVMESLHEYPMNIGCVVYVNFVGDTLRIEKDIRVISDELRSAFIEERDERMRMIAEEIDPGLPGVCYQDCPYSLQCRGK